MLQLKLATEGYKDQVVDLYEELFNYSYYSTLGEYDRVYIGNMYLDSLAMDQTSIVTILLLDDTRLIGAITCTKTGTSYNKLDSMAYELAFWIKPECRTKAAVKKLLEAYYFWAKKVGCKAAFTGKIKKKQGPETSQVRRLV